MPPASRGCGCWWQSTLDLPQEDGRRALFVGIGAGLGSAPQSSGAPGGRRPGRQRLFIRTTFEARARFPGLMASVHGTQIFAIVEGFTPRWLCGSRLPVRGGPWS